MISRENLDACTVYSNSTEPSNNNLYFHIFHTILLTKTSNIFRTFHDVNAFQTKKRERKEKEKKEKKV